MSDLWGIYDNYIKPFEKTDDEYRKRLNAIYKDRTSKKDKWNNFWDSFGSISVSFLKSFVVAFAAAFALALAPTWLVVGALAVLAVGCIIMANVPEESVPSWLSGAKKAADAVADKAVQVLEEGPIVLVEDIGQGFMDQIQTPEGIAAVSGEVIGFVTGGIAGAKVKANIKAKKAETAKVTEPEKPKTKAEILAENKANGRAYEIEKINELKQVANNVEEQITVVTKDGTKIRIDGIGYDKKTGELIVQEYKSSATAPLTNNQKIGFPEITKNGGLVVGKGKGVFKGGFEIPPGTKIEVIRPKYK